MHRSQCLRGLYAQVQSFLTCAVHRNAIQFATQACRLTLYPSQSLCAENSALLYTVACNLLPKAYCFTHSYKLCTAQMSHSKPQTPSQQSSPSLQSSHHTYPLAYQPTVPSNCKQQQHDRAALHAPSYGKPKQAHSQPHPTPRPSLTKLHTPYIPSLHAAPMHRVCSSMHMHACAQHAASAHITLDAYNNHQNKCTLDPPTRLQLPAAARIVAAAAPFSFKKKHGQPINRKQWCSHTHTQHSSKCTCLMILYQNRQQQRPSMTTAALMSCETAGGAELLSGLLPPLLTLSLSTNNSCMLKTIHVTAQHGNQMRCKVVGTVTAGHAHRTQTQQNSHTTKPGQGYPRGTHTHPPNQLKEHSCNALSTKHRRAGPHVQQMLACTSSSQQQTTHQQRR
jgi:hypothetical protein